MRFWLVVVMVGLAGCSDSGQSSTPEADVPEGDSETNGKTTTGTEPTEPEPESSAQPEPTQKRDPVAWSIAIQGNDFLDGSITIQVGDAVTWVHDDGTTPHTVTSDDRASFHSGDCPGAACMSPLNTEFTHSFEDVGEFGYHCEVHQSMTDTITVLERFDGTPSA